MITLFYSDASPYARVCRMVAREANAMNMVTETPINPLENDAEFLKLNPLGKIPCLVLPNGEAIFDSEVIGDFLDTNFNGGVMFSPILESWTLRTYFSLVNGILDSAVALRVEQMREQEGNRSEFWTERYQQAIIRGLKEAESRLHSLPEEMTGIHFALASALDYLDFRHPDLAWQEDYADLQEWYQSMTQRPSFQATRPAV